MSYNGSGTVQINTSGQPVVTGTVISSSAFNALTADLATGLSTAITKDGQTATTVRIPFAQGINSSLATDSTSGSTGSIYTAGGIGIAKALYVGTNATVVGTLGVTGTATFSATPVFSALTASSAVATDASKNLVSVTNTGTGNNVLATSPTLVTPALGTPSSGVMTNVTGINYDGFKNRIINGAMVIDQRNVGASQTFTAAAALAYAVDRWYGYCTGANVTGQQIAGGTTPTVTQNRYRFTGAASVTAVGFGQRIEQKNSYDLAGSTCTLSADLAISATLTTVTWTAYYATTTADTFGSLASPTVTQIATGTFTVSSTVTNFSTNISIPAAATTGIQILFTVGALTAGLTWTIGNVQLEKGSTATSFDYRSQGTELALCQRYYEKSYNQDVVPGVASFTPGFASSTASSNAPTQANGCTFKVTKRANPTCVSYNAVTGASGSAYRVSDGTNVAITLTSPGYNGIGYIDFASNANGYYWHFTASAEL
jgi:hypothetical protein